MGNYLVHFKFSNSVRTILLRLGININKLEIVMKYFK